MATLNSAKRNTTLQLSNGEKHYVRVLDFIVDFANDFTMGTATDDINLATLPAGAIVLAASVQQLEVGTGTGTVVVRAGTTALTGTLTATDAVGTVATTIPAAIPLITPLATAELNLLGATAVRTTGKVRVVVVIVEGDRSPKQPGIAARDAI